MLIPILLKDSVMSSLDPSVRIDTPENVFLEAEIAGFGSRFLAALIDYVIIFVLLIVLAYCGLQPSIQNQDASWVVAAYILLLFGLFVFYHLAFEFIWNGQTPGKRILQIRVVQSNGMPLTIQGLLIRNLIRLFDFLPFFYGVGLLAIFVTKNTQRLGDLAARTIVVREHRRVTLYTSRADVTVTYRHIHHNQEIPAYIELTALTPADRRTLVSYLQRRDELSNPDSIARPLARRIAAAMNAPTVNFYTLYEAETFLELVARAYELADRQRSENQANSRALS